MSVDYDEVGRRLSEIEAILGIDDFSRTKSIPLEIQEIEKKLKDDCNAKILMSIPIEKLEFLNKITTQIGGLSGSLSEKLESVRFAEELINQRVELVKQFEENLQNSLDSATFSKISELQPQLEEEIAVCERLLEKWKHENREFLQFRTEYSIIIQRISEKILELQIKISNKSNNADM